jgi:hypothetical protein
VRQSVSHRNKSCKIPFRLSAVLSRSSITAYPVFATSKGLSLGVLAQGVSRQSQEMRILQRPSGNALLAFVLEDLPHFTREFKIL